MQAYVLKLGPYILHIITGITIKNCQQIELSSVFFKSKLNSHFGIFLQCQYHIHFKNFRLLKTRNTLSPLYPKDPHIRTSWIHLGNTVVILISLSPQNWTASLTSSNAEKTRQSLTLGVSVGEAVSVCEAPVHYQRLSGRRTAVPLHPSTPKRVGRVGSVPRASRKQSITVGETNSLFIYM